MSCNYETKEVYDMFESYNFGQNNWNWLKNYQKYNFFTQKLSKHPPPSP